MTQTERKLLLQTSATLGGMLQERGLDEAANQLEALRIVAEREDGIEGYDPDARVYTVAADE